MCAKLNIMNYEYAIEKMYPIPVSEEQLNLMGSHGWELTGVLKIQEHNRITETFIYYFKRELVKPE